MKKQDRPLHIGIITARDGEYPANHRLLTEITGLGHRGHLVDPYSSRPLISQGRTMVVSSGGEMELPDVLIPRQGAQVSDANIALINHLENLGVPILNSRHSINIAKDKFRTAALLTKASIPTPDTVLINSTGNFDRFVEMVGGYPVILKPTNGRQGQGIKLLCSEGDLQKVDLNPLIDGLLLQKFIPSGKQCDFRAFVIGSEIVASTRMTAMDGEFRTNMHRGAKAESYQLPGKIAEMVIAAARCVGLEVAGVDLVIDDLGNPYILELNYSPGFTGIEKTTGKNIARLVVEHAIAMVATGSG